MLGGVRTLLRRSPLYEPLRALRHRRALRDWYRRGRQNPPPPRFKQRLVKEYARRFGLRVLIETGTYRGDMLYANRHTFDELHSIELGPELCEGVRQRLARYPHIHIRLGDSAVILPELLAEIDRRCLFWLDGHAMWGAAFGPELTPIRAELTAILRHPIPAHVLLIDDARLFTAGSAYPDIGEVRRVIAQSKPHWVVEVREDVIRALLPPTRRSVIQRRNGPRRRDWQRRRDGNARLGGAP